MADGRAFVDRNDVDGNTKEKVQASGILSSPEGDDLPCGGSQVGVTDPAKRKDSFSREIKVREPKGFLGNVSAEQSVTNVNGESEKSESEFPLLNCDTGEPRLDVREPMVTEDSLIDAHEFEELKDDKDLSRIRQLDGTTQNGSPSSCLDAEHNVTLSSNGEMDDEPHELEDSVDPPERRREDGMHHVPLASAEEEKSKMELSNRRIVLRSSAAFYCHEVLPLVLAFGVFQPLGRVHRFFREIVGRGETGRAAENFGSEIVNITGHASVSQRFREVPYKFLFNNFPRLSAKFGKMERPMLSLGDLHSPSLSDHHGKYRKWLDETIPLEYLTFCTFFFVPKNLRNDLFISRPLSVSEDDQTDKENIGAHLRIDDERLTIITAQRVKKIDRLRDSRIRVNASNLSEINEKCRKIDISSDSSLCSVTSPPYGLENARTDGTVKIVCIVIGVFDLKEMSLTENISGNESKVEDCSTRNTCPLLSCTENGERKDKQSIIEMLLLQAVFQSSFTRMLLHIVPLTSDRIVENTSFLNLFENEKRCSEIKGDTAELELDHGILQHPDPSHHGQTSQRKEEAISVKDLFCYRELDKKTSLQKGISDGRSQIFHCLTFLPDHSHKYLLSETAECDDSLAGVFSFESIPSQSVVCGRLDFVQKNYDLDSTLSRLLYTNSKQIRANGDETKNIWEIEHADARMQTCDIKSSQAQKGRNQLCKKVIKVKKKTKHLVKKSRKFVRCLARFFGCCYSSAGGNDGSPSGEEACSISLKAFHQDAENDNKQPPETIYEDEYKRWTTFHKLGNQRLPAQTLARRGLFCNNDNKIQCHSCHRISELIEVFHHPASGDWHHPHCRYTDRQVFADTPGRISDDVRDPPGQQSIYIPPGDVRVEAYRVSTFENFPVPSTSSRRSLAQAGFFFTGFYDRVKCFACGRTVQDWEARDNPGDQKWHKDDCPFMRGENCGNVPITTHFNQIYGNLSTRPSPRNPGEEIIQQRDPVTGAVIRTVRYPADLPERIRQTGGTFEIGPNNQVTIQSGPGAAGSHRGPGLQEAPARLPATPLQQAQHQPMRHWRMANVISADHKRFLTNLYLNRELDRVASFARWPTGRPNVAPAALAKTGFFYLGDMDRTQCFSCGGVLRNWTAEDDAESEHRAHFPNCRLLLRTETRNVPVPDLPVAPEVRQRDFPCRFPSNPHMRSEVARIETFDQRWPRNRTAATPAEIAQAGFFYLGERDRVKCWYCNGGLQHWEYDDVPWIEHAKWFPNCQFLLSVKGQHFVYRHLAMCPQLPRPIIARQDGSPLEPGSGQRSSGPPEDIPPTAARVRQPSPPPTIIDPQEEMRKKQERIDNVMKNSDTVKNVLAMGFSEQIVRQLLVEKVDSGTEDNPDDIYGSAVALLEDVMKREQEMEQEEEQRSNVAAAATSLPGPSTSYVPSIPSVYMPSPQSSLGPAPGSGKYNVSYFGDDDEEGGPDMYGTEPMETSANSETPAKQVGEEEQASLQEALTKIEEERMCKVCFSNPADMVFVPCGHMCCCMECTQALRQCPVCRVKIQKAIKTYLS